MKISMTHYAAGNHFVAGRSGTYIPGSDPDQFMAVLTSPEVEKIVSDGYAPFCKHVFVRNFTAATNGVITITPENRHLLMSAYEARRPEELPVLTRWFPREAIGGHEVGIAPWLDVIVYSNEHLVKEGMPIDSEWGIIAIHSASSPEEAPMIPITMMRNALGIAEGGSGVPLDREAYLKAVGYWGNRAVLR